MDWESWVFDFSTANMQFLHSSLTLQRRVSCSWHIWALFIVSHSTRYTTCSDFSLQFEIYTPLNFNGVLQLSNFELFIRQCMTSIRDIMKWMNHDTDCRSSLIVPYSLFRSIQQATFFKNVGRKNHIRWKSNLTNYMNFEREDEETNMFLKLIYTFIFLMSLTSIFFLLVLIYSVLFSNLAWSIAYRIATEQNKKHGGRFFNTLNNFHQRLWSDLAPLISKLIENRLYFFRRNTITRPDIS